MRSQYEQDIKKAKKLLLNGWTEEQVEEIIRKSAVSRASLEIIDDCKQAKKDLEKYFRIKDYIEIQDILILKSKL